MMILQIAGRLGKDPETRFTQSGLKVTNLTVATNVRKAGKDETVWWRVTIWGDRFDKMITFLKKGSAVVVVGEMSKPEIYTDKEGRPQVSMEMTADMLKFSPFGNPEASKSEGATGSQSTNQSGQRNQNANAYGEPQPAGYQATSFGQGNSHEMYAEVNDEAPPF